MPQATLAIDNYLDDRNWVDDRYEELAQKYDRHYIAVLGKTVIGFGNTIPELKKKIETSALFTSASNPVIVYVTRESSSMLL